MSMDMSMISVILTSITASAYGYMHFLALAKHSGCDQGTPQDEHFKRYWGASLIIAATMATTILILKFLSPNGPIFMALLSLIATIGAGMFWKTLKDCEATDEEKMNAIYYITAFSLLFILSLAMYRKGGSTNNTA